MDQKLPKTSHKSPFLLVQEALNIYNLTTINAIKMKLGTIVYLHQTFRLRKDLGTSFKAWQDVALKPPKNPPKLKFLDYFLEIFSTI